MKTKLYRWWHEMRSSFWLVPAVIVFYAVTLASVLVAVDATIDPTVVDRWPLLFGAGADGARGLLTAVAGSMITLAGVIFSITIVVLSLTSSQYTSRVLRNFMRDRINQVVLGVFVGIFAYCLSVLRTIRGGDEGAFVPSLAVLVALILAFVGIGFLIYFIHYISMCIQASHIIAVVANETIAAVDRLFPEELGCEADEDTEDKSAMSLETHAWYTVPARQTGYIESIDRGALLALAQGRWTILRMEHGIGDFVIKSTPLVSAAGPGSLDEETTDKLNAVYIISRQRTVEQNPSFGIRQIVDIAIKALSPGINDTTTAVMCLDYLAAILVSFATRRIATPRCYDQEDFRVIDRGPSFESLLAEAFDQIRQNAEGNVAVMSRMLSVLQTIARMTASPSRRRAILGQVKRLAELAARTISSPHDRERLDIRLARVQESFETEGFCRR